MLGLICVLILSVGIVSAADVDADNLDTLSDSNSLDVANDEVSAVDTGSDNSISTTTDYTRVDVNVSNDEDSVSSTADSNVVGTGEGTTFTDLQYIIDQDTAVLLF